MKPNGSIADVWTATTQQATFRRLLETTSYPGVVRNLQDITAAPAYLAFLATLIDPATTFSDADGILTGTELGMLDVQSCPKNEAAFVLLRGDRKPDDDFHPSLGTVYQPERGATLLLTVDTIGKGHQSVRLNGPGISTPRTLSFSGLHPSWLSRRDEWVNSFPLGVDWFLCSETDVVSIPRTTQIEVPLD